VEIGSSGLKTIYVITATVGDYFSKTRPYSCVAAYIDRDVAAQDIEDFRSMNNENLAKFDAEYQYWVLHRDTPYPVREDRMVYDILELKLNERVSE